MGNRITGRMPLEKAAFLQRLTGHFAGWLCLMVCLAQFASPEPLAAAAKNDTLEQARAQVECPEWALNKKLALIIGPAPGAQAAGLDLAGACAPIQNCLEEKFFEVFYEIIDRATLESNLPEQMKLLVLQGDMVAAADLGQKLGADLLLIGRLSGQAQKLTAVQTNLKTVNVQLSIKLVDAKSAKILSSFTLSERTAGLDPSSAATKLIEKRADSIVAKIYRQYCTRAPRLLSKPADAKTPEASPQLSDTLDTKQRENSPVGGASDSTSLPKSLDQL